jgi:hypothetical protein
MAIDTAEKRRAVAAFACVFLAPGVTPNGSPDAEWRQEALWSYPGISAAAEPPTLAMPPLITGVWRPRLEARKPEPVDGTWRPRT